MQLPKVVLPIRDGLPRHAEVGLGLIHLTTKCHHIGRSEGRAAIAQVLEGELDETFRMSPLGLFRSSLPPGGGGLKTRNSARTRFGNDRAFDGLLGCRLASVPPRLTPVPPPPNSAIL